MTEVLAAAAPAKINLYLHVLGRRPDGYHLLDSLAVFAGAADRLTARPAAALSLAIAGPFAAGLGADDDNLVLRAAKALRTACPGAPAGAALTLEKHLPVASGIGGGSADAAAALRVLNRLWGLRLAPRRLAEIALGLGADVPVCLASRPARMGGVGEVLTAAPALPPCGLLLANPGVALATAAVFRARSGTYAAAAALPARWPTAAAMARDLRDGTLNDLEAPAISLCPAIADVLAAIGRLPGVQLARMSGSGATCFGLFATEDAARSAQRALGQVPGWWVWSGGLHAA